LMLGWGLPIGDEAVAKLAYAFAQPLVGVGFSRDIARLRSAHARRWRVQQQTTGFIKADLMGVERQGGAHVIICVERKLMGGGGGRWLSARQIVRGQASGRDDGEADRFGPLRGALQALHDK